MLEIKIMLSVVLVFGVWAELSVAQVFEVYAMLSVALLFTA